MPKKKYFKNKNSLNRVNRPYYGSRQKWLELVKLAANSHVYLY